MLSHVHAKLKPISAFECLRGVCQPAIVRGSLEHRRALVHSVYNSLGHPKAISTESIEACYARQNPECAAGCITTTMPGRDGINPDKL